MNNGKKYLVFGVIIGIVLAFLYFQFFAPRYEIKKTGISTIRIDKWTGQSWRFADNTWKRILDMDENWEQIDRTLQEALGKPYTQVDSGVALKSLRDKYPILNDLSDDELLERIKLVYSKLVLCNLYLTDFLNIKESGSAGEVSAKDK